MNYRDFSNKVNQLDNVYGKIALVDSSKIECLKLDGEGNYTWEKVQIEGLPFIPIIVYPKVSIDEENKVISYSFNRELRAPHMSLPTTYEEKYVVNLSEDSEGEYYIDFSVEPIDEQIVPVRFNNESYKTLDHTRHGFIVNDYITRHKRKLWEFMAIVDESITTYENINSRQKTK